MSSPLDTLGFGQKYRHPFAPISLSLPVDRESIIQTLGLTPEDDEYTLSVEDKIADLIDELLKATDVRDFQIAYTPKNGQVTVYLCLKPKESAMQYSVSQFPSVELFQENRHVAHLAEELERYDKGTKDTIHVTDGSLQNGGIIMNSNGLIVSGSLNWSNIATHSITSQSVPIMTLDAGWIGSGNLP